MIPTVDNEYLSITAYHQGTYMFSYDFQNHQYSFVMCFQFSKEVYSLWHLFICFFSTDSFNRHLFSISMSQTQPLPSWSSSRENRYVNTQLLYKVLNSCHENCSGHTVGTKECDRLCFTKEITTGNILEFTRKMGADGFPSSGNNGGKQGWWRLKAADLLCQCLHKSRHPLYLKTTAP